MMTRTAQSQMMVVSAHAHACIRACRHTDGQRHIILDFQWHCGISKFISSDIFQRNYICQRYFPKDCHLSSGFLLDISNGFPIAFFRARYLSVGASAYADDLPTAGSPRRPLAGGTCRGAHQGGPAQILYYTILYYTILYYTIIYYTIL